MRYSPETDLSYTYSWGNKPAADLPGNGTTREEWKVGTAMLDLSRHRRLSLTGETLVNPLSTVSAFSRVYVVARPHFIPRAPKKRERRWGTVLDTRTGTILFYKPFASHVCDSLLRQQFSLWAVKRNAPPIASNITKRLDWQELLSPASVTVSKPWNMRVCRCTSAKLLEFEMPSKENLVFYKHITVVNVI